MAIGDQYRQIEPGDRWIEDSAGNIVGVQNPRGKFGAETRWLTADQVSATQALVSTPGNPSQPGPAVSFFSATGGLWAGLVADGVPAPWATALFARLWSSIKSDYGPQPTFARDADYSVVPYTTDDQGMLHATQVGEAMFYGARRERQLCRYTENLSFSGTNGWTLEGGCTVAAQWDDNKPTADGLGIEAGTVWKLTAAASANSAIVAQAGQVLEAVPHVFAVRLRADSAISAEIEIAVSGGATLATKVVSVTTSWQWFYVPGTPDGSSSYVYRIAPATKAATTGGTVYACMPQLHTRVGVTTAPPAYFSRDAAPVDKYWHGAAVDGVKYFHETNANNLVPATGVVVPHAGSSLGEADAVSSDLTTWGRSGIASVSAADANGWHTLLEDTAGGSTAHHINISATDSASYQKRWLSFEADVKQIDGANRGWVRLFVQDLDGATGKSAYVNIATGAIGTVSFGMTAQVEAGKDGGWRIIVGQQLGTASNNAVVRIYSVTADNTPTHAGDAAKGLMVRRARVTLRTCRGVDLFPTYSQLLDTRISTWATADTGTVSTVTGPDGRQSAIQYLEGTGGTAHHINSSLIGSSTYDGKWTVLSVYAKARSSTDRQWLRVFFQDIDGTTTRSAYFNIGTGAKGTTDANMLTDVEYCGDGWFRLHAATLIGAGASNAVVRFYVCTADNTPTHTGDTSKGILLFMPNATSAISSASTSDRAICMPPAPNPSASPVTIPGSHLSYFVGGVLRNTDFGVFCNYTPYYKPTRTSKGGEDGFAYTCPTYVRCDGPPDTLTGATYGQFDTCRTGLTIRPNKQGTEHYGKWAFDLYAGNPNAQFVWKPNTAYTDGQIVIPTATKPNNASPAQKVYTCTQAGTSGATEPSWNTSGFPTVEQTDGTCKWQSNEDNGISGNWEPYLGAQLTPPNDLFMHEQRVGWFLTGSDYGCWNNGAAHTKQTLANYVNGMPTTLPYRPKTLWVGQFGGNDGVPGAKSSGVADAALMSTYRAFVRDLHVYHTAPSDETFRAETALW